MNYQVIQDAINNLCEVTHPYDAYMAQLGIYTVRKAGILHFQKRARVEDNLYNDFENEANGQTGIAHLLNMTGAFLTSWPNNQHSIDGWMLAMFDKQENISHFYRNFGIQLEPVLTKDRMVDIDVSLLKEMTLDPTAVRNLALIVSERIIGYYYQEVLRLVEEKIEMIKLSPQAPKHEAVHDVLEAARKKIRLHFVALLQELRENYRRSHAPMPGDSLTNSREFVKKFIHNETATNA